MKSLTQVKTLRALNVSWICTKFIHSLTSWNFRFKNASNELLCSA